MLHSAPKTTTERPSSRATCSTAVIPARLPTAPQTHFCADTLMSALSNISSTMMDDLTAFQRDLLYVTVGLENGSPPHGLAIKESLEADYTAEINHGRLYPNLDTLVDKGLIEKTAIDKRTNGYSVTKRGQREMEARREWERQHTGDTS